MLNVKVVGSNKCIVVDEVGKEYEVIISFHARTLNGEYKYHELYVYLNKHEAFKKDYKAPKTLKQKWYYNEETRKFRGPRLLGYEETIGTNSRVKFDINELEFE